MPPISILCLPWTSFFQVMNEVTFLVGKPAPNSILCLSWTSFFQVIMKWNFLWGNLRESKGIQAYINIQMYTHGTNTSIVQKITRLQACSLTTMLWFEEAHKQVCLQWFTVLDYYDHKRIYFYQQAVATNKQWNETKLETTFIQPSVIPMNLYICSPLIHSFMHPTLNNTVCRLERMLGKFWSLSEQSSFVGTSKHVAYYSSTILGDLCHYPYMVCTKSRHNQN